MSRSSNPTSIFKILLHLICSNYLAAMHVARTQKQLQKETLAKLPNSKQFPASNPKAIMNPCHNCFFLYLMLLIIVIVCNLGKHFGPSNKFLNSFYEDKNQSTVVAVQTEELYLNNRKLLLHGSCTNRDISISQSKDSTSGIPQYIVQIVNTCVSGCALSDIHLHCGWFASARIVNPRTFKRLSFDDCLVNGGEPLKTSQIIRFTYSNSFMYPLAFKTAKFC